MAKTAKKKKATPRKPKATDGEIAKKRAKAYSDMEPRICDLARAAELAMTVFDDPNLFLFAVGQLDAMAQRFRADYYAVEFPPE